MHGVESKADGAMLNRIELSELLMNEYLYAKQDWEVERDALISQASQVRFILLGRTLPLIPTSGGSRDARVAEGAERFDSETCAHHGDAPGATRSEIF
jgi:hypothetical protein